MQSAMQNAVLIAFMVSAFSYVLIIYSSVSSDP